MIIYFADMPQRAVKAEEYRKCARCKKNTKHAYEEVSFHAKALFVKIFCYKRRFVRLCTECHVGEELSEGEFKSEVASLTGTSRPASRGSHKPFEKSKQAGIRYCSTCGERIYPDIGYCASCAVRKPPSKK